jgi:hypothetical protein
MTHGAYSPRVVDPLAQAIVAAQLESPSCPPHLRDDPERWRYALEAWGRQEATVRLLRDWLAGQDVETALSEAEEIEETTTHKKGGSTRHTSVRRRESALKALDRAERAAAARRNELGLTPRSAAVMKLSTDSRPNLMQLAAEIYAAGKETPGDHSGN